MDQEEDHAVIVQADLEAETTSTGNYSAISVNEKLPIHPDVRLTKLAFYDVLATLIQPSSLIPQTNTGPQEASFCFALTPQQATDIACNRDMFTGCKVQYTIQVQLRFCLLETSCEQEDCFPSNVTVRVNNKLCQLPGIITANRQFVEPKMPRLPVDITEHVLLSPTVTNRIAVQWNPQYVTQYCLSVFLVRRLTSHELLKRMKSKRVKPEGYTRALIKEKLKEDTESEIATTRLTVSLVCPLGRMRMSTPSRPSTCSHLQCFDASLFLQMNEQRPTWTCPICDKPIAYETLVIDGYFLDVLASPLLSNDDTEIQLHEDGSWTPLRNERHVLIKGVEIAVLTTNTDMINLIKSDPESKDLKKVEIAVEKQVKSIPVGKVLPNARKPRRK